MLKYAEAQGTPVIIPEEGDTFPLGGAVVTVLHFWPEAWTTNDTSIVLRVDYGLVSFLFMADADYMTEFLANGEINTSIFRLLFCFSPQTDAILSSSVGNEPTGILGWGIS